MIGFSCCRAGAPRAVFGDQSAAGLPWPTCLPVSAPSEPRIRTLATPGPTGADPFPVAGCSCRSGHQARRATRVEEYLGSRAVCLTVEALEAGRGDRLKLFTGMDDENSE